MEFHADLVAVSLTGSDALVNSLYKLSAADESFDSAISFLNHQLKDKKKITDIYALQANSVTQMRTVLNNPDYGKSPTQDHNSGKNFMVFKEQMAQTPKMWNTHPSNIDREKNAKKIFITANIDDRTAWVLFKNPEKTKEQLTLALFKNIETDDATTLSKEEAIEIQNKEYQRSFLLPKYRGIYHNRYITISNHHVNYIYDPIAVQNLSQQFAGLYPPELQDQLKHLKNLEEELFMLEGLRKKILTTNEGKIIFRGREIKNNELAGAIQTTKKEAEVERDKIDQHLKFCRNLYYQTAKTLDGGWDQYLASLTMLIHYCEHTQKNIEILSQFFYDTLSTINRYRRVNATDILYLCRIANELHAALKGVFTYGVSIKLNAQVISRLNGKKFDELLEPFKLNEAENANINSWVNVVGSWINLANSALNELRLAALDELLETEVYIEKVSCSGNLRIEKAPELIEIEDTYPKYDPTIKREVVNKIDFYSKFHNAEGFFPSLAKYSVAAIIIFIAVFFATHIGTSKIVVYNGFPEDVVVYADQKGHLVKTGEASEISVDIVPELNIKATTIKGELIESFKQKLGNHSKTYVYNIANAAVIYSWVVYYGYNKPGNDDSLLGAPRWIELEADDYFTAPPESVSLHAGETQTRVVVAEYKAPPEQLVSIINNEKERNDLIQIHAIWDNLSSPYILSWLMLSAELKNHDQIIRKRLQLYPLDVPALRACQDLAKGKEKENVCEQQRKLFLKDPENPNLYYLNCRCLEDEAKSMDAFLRGHQKWPRNPWLAYATGYFYIKHEKWSEALSCFDTVFKHGPVLRQYIIDEIKRISQLVGRENPTEYKNLELTYLTFVSKVENSTELNPGDKYYAFKLLAKGELDKAVNFANSDTNIYGVILRLAAVSTGAPKSVIGKAMALPKNSFINSATLIPAIALASKNNLPLSDFEEALKRSYGEYADSVYKFIDLVKHNKLAEAEQLTNIGKPQIKGQMSLLGVLLLGNKTLEKWKLYADKLLYITEKPYLDMK
jgi:hypothetical protein